MSHSEDPTVKLRLAYHNDEHVQYHGEAIPERVEDERTGPIGEALPIVGRRQHQVYAWEIEDQLDTIMSATACLTDELVHLAVSSATWKNVNAIDRAAQMVRKLMTPKK